MQHIKKSDKKIIRFIRSRSGKLPALAKYLLKKKIKYFLTKTGIGLLPATVMMRVTYRCNLHCFFCGQFGDQGVYRFDKGINKGVELDFAQWKAFIESVRHFHPYMYFTGGEPLLRDDIEDLIKAASAGGLLTHLNTNCTLLERKADGLVGAGLDYISCSLDCTDDLSETVTGKKETYCQTVAGIKALLRVRESSGNGLPVVQIFTTINRHNQHHLFTIAQLVQDLGVDVFAISFPIFTTPELEARTAAQFKEALGVESRFWKGFIADMSGIDSGLIKEQLAKITSAKWNFIYRQFPAYTKDFDVYAHFQHPERIHGRRSCGLPWSLAVILPNGDVATCWDHPDYIVGNILKERFIDIWNGPRYRKFREVIRRGVFPSCSRCTGLYQ
jgi:radical SAM protein with 4Fe4S-binding SPASM domain